MNIVIVGGGNAGWLSALMMAKLAPHHEYTLITSEDISPIGVGEGTTGKFLNVLNRPIMGIDFNEMISSINALPKLGIKFENWSPYGDFYSPLEGSITNEYYIDYAAYVSQLNNHFYTHATTSILMKHELSNLKYNNCESGSAALHLDTNLTTEYLKRKCIESGVRHINSTVKYVNTNGKIIDSICVNDGNIIEADLFVDCTGFARVISKHLTDWIDFSGELPVNSAVVFECEKYFPKKPYTTATAMKYGWTWEIPTKQRTGRGYVYCDEYTNEEEILKELHAYYKCDIKKIRKLNFTSGKSSQFLVGNCLALGLSAAFLEPLQATSLHCTLVQIDEFIHTFLYGTNSVLYDEDSVNAYNEKCHLLYDTTKDFVCLHYTGGRNDTEFWKYFINHTPERVKKILHFAHTRLNRSYDFDFCKFSGGTSSIWNSTIVGLGHCNNDLIAQVLKENHVCIEDYVQFLRGMEKQILTDHIPFNKYCIT